MSKRSPETLSLVMDYAALMEACAAYVAVNRPSIREPEAAKTLERILNSKGPRRWEVKLL